MDEWCKQKLLPVDRHDNGLLYCDQTNNTWFVSSSIWVEVFHTEDIMITRDEVRCFGARRSHKRFPEKKTRGCETCNID